eukprot:g3468.t1
MLQALTKTATRFRASLFRPIAVRFLNIHEYQASPGSTFFCLNNKAVFISFQGAELMNSYGINVPPGIPITSLTQLDQAIDKMKDNGDEVVLKSQILAGGRGLGQFKTGLKGGVHICTSSEAKALAKEMLNQILVTKQTGPIGKPVNTLYIAQKMKLKNEKYFAILLDRESNGPILIGCSEGGTSIEELAESKPEKIIKIPVDITTGLTNEQAKEMVEGLKVSGDPTSAINQIKSLYKLFIEKDCMMVEVNPLAENEQGELIAADAKLSFDDNASFRQESLFKLKDHTQQDQREVEAERFDLNYIGLDGSIGCLVNGAGLAMATMDIIKLHGGSPANFLDVGGSASEDQVIEAFKILTSDKQVKAILVNIFGKLINHTNLPHVISLGGIMKCDVIANGIVKAAERVQLSVPLVVRLEGTNVEQGKRILNSSNMRIISANDLDEAASNAVKVLQL